MYSEPDTIVAQDLTGRTEWSRTNVYTDRTRFANNQCPLTIMPVQSRLIFAAEEPLAVSNCSDDLGCFVTILT